MADQPHVEVCCQLEKGYDGHDDRQERDRESI